MKTDEIEVSDVLCPGWGAIEVQSLLVQLQAEIGDEYRCSNDPDDDEPGMMVTIATTDLSEWGWQTGDNSYTGGAYPFRHWSVIYLYRDSDCAELAGEAFNELRDMVEESKTWAVNP